MFNKEMYLKKVFLREDLQDNYDLRASLTQWILLTWSTLLVTVQRKKAEFVLTWPVIYS